MTEDKGQNQVVIDWLVNPSAQGDFVMCSEGVLGYVQLQQLVAVARSDEVSLVVPSLDLGSVGDIYSAVARGPAVIKSRRGWVGVQLPTDVMTLLYTSGSTGDPKLVPLSVRNWHAAVAASAEHLGHEPDDVWLLAMPLHHVGGLSVLFRSSFVGAGVRLLESFEAGSFADALSTGVTMASVVPTMLRRVLDYDARRYDGLKAVLVGGGPIPGGLLEEAHERGIPALPTYGMTETCAQVATLRPGSPVEHRAELLPGIEARTGDEGRIELRGEQVFDGYLGGPTRREGEWFVTGDLGRVADGSLEVYGRADDVIVTGGVNVDPGLVESKVRRAAGVEDVMVVGVSSDEWGQEIVGLYVGSVDVEALDREARAILERHEVPKRWIRVDAIPASDLGKPDRSAGRSIAISLSSG